MSQLVARAKAHLVALWRTSAPLTAIALLMLPVLLASAVGLVLDPRTLAGAPAWLKPAKFAASIALYSLTLAWAFRYLPEHVRTRRFVGRTAFVVFAIEIFIICLQAARGTTSHFNVSTPLNAALFTIMGLAIATQTLVSVAVAVALWRQKFADRALGWALRLGLTISIAGAALGGLMTRPTDEQLVELRAGRVSVSGAHTVGAPDGGPGLVGTGWSREHGDLRAPHFLGLHALQVLPLMALGARRARWSEARRVRLMLGAGISYVSLLGILLWQALRGQSLILPDASTGGALVAWLALTLVLVGQAVRRPRASGHIPMVVS
jgi:hypothetical protein